MFTTFDESTRKLLDGRNFATVSTLNADGGPQASVVWYRRDGDTIVFSATEDRAKVRNLRRDRRVSVTVFDLGDPYHSVEIRGTVEIVPDPAKELPLELSLRYLGEAPPHEPDEIARVIVCVTPTRVNSFRL